MPNFGAEYNTILNNLATLYDLRQEKIEVVKINKRIDQVSSMIKHPLVQDATGVIHSYNTSTGAYMPVSVLPVAVLPNPAHYQNGAIVSVAGVLYVQKSGLWEGVGGASTLSIFNAEGVALEQASAINIDFPLTLESNKIYKLFCLIYNPTLQKVNIGEGFVVRIYDSWIITNQWYRDEMGDYTFTPDESNGRIIVGSDLGDLNYQISLVPTI